MCGLWRGASLLMWPVRAGTGRGRAAAAWWVGWWVGGLVGGLVGWWVGWLLCAGYGAGPVF